MSQAEPVAWSDLAVADLDVPTLYAVLALRASVFVVEQECAYQDPDGLDLLEGTRHLLGRNNGGNGPIAAYARILAPDVVVEQVAPASGQSRPEHPTPRIGRVIVSGETRGLQLGRRLMDQAIACCEKHWSNRPIELGAQTHLAAFYGSLGFAATGEPYDEDGIAHVWMRRDVR